MRSRARAVSVGSGGSAAVSMADLAALVAVLRVALTAGLRVALLADLAQTITRVAGRAVRWAVGLVRVASLAALREVPAGRRVDGRLFVLPT